MSRPLLHATPGTKEEEESKGGAVLFQLHVVQYVYWRKFDRVGRSVTMAGEERICNTTTVYCTGVLSAGRSSILTYT
jgi:hypothetical protein